MTRILMLGFVALCGAAVSRGAGQDNKNKPPAKNLCDMKKTEKALYCPKCDAFLDKNTLDPEKNCSMCSSKPKEVTVCVKVYYQADCHPEKISDKPITCCKKTYDTPLTDRARIAYYCSGCQNSAATAAEMTHPKGCKVKEAKAYCTKSGAKPHVKE